MSEKSRMEEILSAMLEGKPENMPEPQSRMEEYLQAMAARVANVPYKTEATIPGDWVLRDILFSQLAENEFAFIPEKSFIAGRKYIVSCNGISIEYEAHELSATTEDGTLINGAYIGDSPLSLDAGEPLVYGFTAIDTVLDGVWMAMLMPFDISLVFGKYGLLSEEEAMAAFISIRESDRTSFKVNNRLPVEFVDVDWAAKYNSVTLKSIFTTKADGSAIPYAFGDFIKPSDAYRSFVNRSYMVPGTKIIVKTASSDNDEPTVYETYVYRVREEAGDTEVVIGNLSYLNDDYPDTGEPFIMSVYMNATHCVAATCQLNDDSEYASFSIEVPATTNPIPKEFLPEDIVNAADSSLEALTQYKNEIKSEIMKELTLPTPELIYLYDEGVSFTSPTSHGQNVFCHMRSVSYDIFDSIDIYSRSGNNLNGKTFLYRHTIDKNEFIEANHSTNYGFDLTSIDSISYGDDIVCVIKTSKHSIPCLDSDYSNVFHYKKFSTPVLSFERADTIQYELTWTIDNTDGYTGYVVFARIDSSHDWERLADSYSEFAVMNEYSTRINSAQLEKNYPEGREFCVICISHYYLPSEPSNIVRYEPQA